MEYSRYKDREPRETIQLAKNILESFNLECVETIIHNPLKNVYSSRLDVPSLNFCVSGKGTTEDYCMASAYGEMMEKLLNVYFPSNFFYVSRYHHFSSFYDEVEFNLTTDLINLPNGILDDMRTSFYESDNRYPTIEELIDVYQTKFGTPNITTIPFYDVRNNCVTYLPEKIISSLAHSTGLSCGNTLEEAVSQAICEIFERYAYTQIFVNNLTPPKISMEYIVERCPDMVSIIEQFVSNGYELTFYDCSLGKKLPVVGLLLVNKHSGLYKLNFGSHISFNIAVERCLTEILQGYDELSNIVVGMSKFSEDFDGSWNSYYMRFRKNVGAVPKAFFMSKPSWQFDGWSHQYDSLTNKDVVRILTNICLDLSSTVYIRNNSYGGLSAVRVYVPGVSYMKYIEPKGLYTKYDVEQRYILEGCDYDNIVIEDVSKYLNIVEANLGRIEKFVGIPNRILLAAIYYDMGDVQKSMKLLHAIEYKPQYINVILSILECLDKKYSIDDINSVLQSFFNEEDIKFGYFLLQGNFFQKLLVSRKSLNYSRKYYEGVEENTFSYVSAYIQKMKEQQVNQLDTSSILFVDLLS